MSTSRLALAALLLTVAACDRTTRPTEADDTCQQTYEFGNSGCFEVRGRVIDSTGRALAGVLMVTGPSADRAGFNTPTATTDASGAFALRAARMFARVPAPVPDTITIVVYAADRRTQGVGVPVMQSDSARVLVTIAPVGQVPNPTTITVTLPVR